MDCSLFHNMKFSIVKVCIAFLNLAGIDRENWKISQLAIFLYSILNGVLVMVLVSFLFVYTETPIVMTDITNALSCFLVIVHVSKIS